MDNEKMMQDISRGIRNLNIEFSIKSPPVYNLKECLNFYTKDRLYELGYEHGIRISKGKKKSKMIEILERKILENVEDDLLYTIEKERKTIVKVIEKAKENEINLEYTKNFKNLGYIFQFYHNGEIKSVCPDLVADKYMTAYLKDNKEIYKLHNDLSNYVRALQNIYGVFEISQLATVWNQHNVKKLDEEFMSNFLDKIGRKQNYFWWDPPYIISDYFMDIEEYEEFLERRINKEYYMPIKKEIEYYIKEEFDVDNPYYKRMEKYLKKQRYLNEVELDDLLLFIEIGCTIDNSPQEIIDQVIAYGFEFDDINDVNKFVGIYANLSNNSRKWELKGYKPVELAADIPTNSNNNVIPFAKPTKRKNKKIGRNEPCPCGSGNKYKFCCGK